VETPRNASAAALLREEVLLNSTFLSRGLVPFPEIVDPLLGTPPRGAEVARS